MTLYHTAIAVTGERMGVFNAIMTRVTWALQACNRGINRVLQRCDSDVTVVLQVCYNSVTVVLEKGFRDVTYIHQAYRKCVTLIQEKNFSGVQRMLKGCNIDVTRL